MDNDPHNVAGRLYMHMVRLLDRLDMDQGLTVRERVQAMLGVGHLLRDFAALRKETGNAEAGAAARKYGDSFKAQNGTRRGEGDSGHDNSPPDDDAESIDRLLDAATGEQSILGSDSGDDE